MGERVFQLEWRNHGHCSMALGRDGGPYVGAWPDGVWRVYGKGGAMVAGDTASDLASAKLAAEAALRERGLIAAETPRDINAIASVIDRAVAKMKKDINNAWFAGPDVMFAPKLHALPIAPMRLGFDGISSAMRDASAAFAALAAAMQTPEGRRVLAVQAVEEAVADGVRRGLDAEALRVALAGACEDGSVCRDIGARVFDALDNIVQQRDCFPHEIDDCDRYRRALAARSAKPLGRPSYRKREH